jgi:FAD/FMN-containing dehydrogenase
MTDRIIDVSSSLSDQLRGCVSMPEEPQYRAAISTWAKQVGVAPSAVVHCHSAAHVQAAILAARERDLPLSVRGGGHDWAGRALCDGVVIDLGEMRNVVLSSDCRTAIVSGGTRVADVTTLTDSLGLAAVAGSVGSVGMTGLALGGGYGPLIGRFGLALDNVMEAEVVLADGSIVRASPEHHAELFWALRGGGGNFGVVTSMRHRLHQLPAVHSGLLVYPFSEARTVLERCATIAASMPDEFSLQIGLAAGQDGTFVVMVIPTWCGPSDEGEARLACFMGLGTLLAGTIERKSYGTLLATFDSYLVSGLRMFMETCSAPEMDGDCIDTFIGAIAAAVSPGCAIFTHDFKGAASRVPADATAFGLRRDHIMIEVMALFPDQASALDEQRHRDWTRSTRLSFARTIPGGYPNLLGRDDPDRAALSYGNNAERLLSVKRRYDPDNVFFSAIPLPRRRPEQGGPGA